MKTHPGARALRLALLGATMLLAAACGEEGGSCPGAPTAGPDADPRLAYPPVGTTPATLDEWDLFADPTTQTPKDDVIAYEVSAPLFTDYATKHRFLYVPPGEGCEVGYDATEKWSFPRGTVLVKTFAYPVDEGDPGLGEQLIETRLLVNEGSSGWRPLVYQWNDEGTEATLNLVGDVVSVSYTLEDDTQRDIPLYLVPPVENCKDCHDISGDIEPLGPSSPMLDVANDYGAGPENQIDFMHERFDLFDRAPDAIASRLVYPDPFEVGGPNSDTDKARAYMQSNCGHCHSRNGPVSDKELFLDWESTDPDGTTDPLNWGVCKVPTSAGNADDCGERDLDVVPGDPDASLLACRVEITTAGLMPPIGRSVQHGEGLALVRAWIEDMDLPPCD